MNRNRSRYCIAVDMGASNIRIMLGEISASHFSFREVHRFNNDILQREERECWDFNAILAGIISGIRKAAEGSPVDSIGVDCWGVDFALVDEKLNLLEDPVAYRDKRTEGMEKKWLGMMDRLETFRRTGINFYIFNTLFQVLAARNQLKTEAAKEGPGRLHRVLFLPSFVLSQLCGTGQNEHCIASTSQMLNAETGDWDSEIFRILGLSPELFGKICPPGTILGALIHPELTGPEGPNGKNTAGMNLRSTRAVAVCGHDTACAVAAVPFENPDSVFISTGTWCIVGIENREAILTEEALKSGFTNERGYGNMFRFLKNIVGLWLVQGLIKSFGMSEDYGLIEEMAGKAAGTGPLINPEDPLFYNPPDMKQAFDVFFLRTGQDFRKEKGVYFRCAYDSLVFSFRRHIELIEEMTGRTIRTIHLIGGGCKSRYLSQRTAEICSRVVVSGPEEAASAGNLLIQGISLGVLPGIEKARALIRKSLVTGMIHPGKPADTDSKSYEKYLGISRV